MKACGRWLSVTTVLRPQVPKGVPAKRPTVAKARATTRQQRRWPCPASPRGRFGALPELLEIRVAGREVIGFPALYDDGESVSLRPYDTPEEAARVHRRGLARLFALNLKDQVRAIERLPGLRELALQYMSFGTEAELKARLVEATLTRCCLLEPLPDTAEAFAMRCASQDAGESRRAGVHALDRSVARGARCAANACRV